MIQVTIDKKQWEDIIKTVGHIQKGLPKVMTRGVNQTLSTVYTQAAARVGNEINMPASRIKKDLKKDNATYSFGNTTGQVTCKSRPPGLINFGAKALKKGGVSFKVWRKGSRKTLKRAFIARGKEGDESGKMAEGKGNLHVWRRKWYLKNPSRGVVPGRKYGPWLPKKYRAPLQCEYGPRVASILERPEVMEPIIIQANHVLLKNLNRELDAVMRGY